MQSFNLPSCYWKLCSMPFIIIFSFKYQQYVKDDEYMLSKYSWQEGFWYNIPTLVTFQQDIIQIAIVSVYGMSLCICVTILLWLVMANFQPLYIFFKKSILGPPFDNLDKFSNKKIEWSLWFFFSFLSQKWRVWGV